MGYFLDAFSPNSELTPATGLGRFAMAFFFISLPQEVLFRGVVQNLLHSYFDTKRSIRRYTKVEVKEDFESSWEGVFAEFSDDDSFTYEPPGESKSDSGSSVKMRPLSNKGANKKVAFAANESVSSFNSDAELQEYRYGASTVGVETVMWLPWHKIHRFHLMRNPLYWFSFPNFTDYVSLVGSTAFYFTAVSILPSLVDVVSRSLWIILYFLCGASVHL